MEKVRIMPKLVEMNGARIEDKLVLEPFQRTKKTISLTRTEYLIKYGDEFSLDYSKCEISLPNYGDKNILCTLKLIYPEQNNTDNGRYFIESKFAIRVNGNWCFECFIERGDVVEIGFNKFTFKLNTSGTIEKTELSPAIVKSDLSILIEGETGTGKTSLAKKIHEASGLNGNFVHINLSAYSSNLIESEIFGHVKGAFTGAVNDKKGAILEANKGTLFLDEIDSVSLEIQTKLLLFLESKEFRPVGSERVIKCNTRIIFASGSKLKKLVEEKRMRKDFYFRINQGVCLELKPLRLDTARIRDLCIEFQEKEESIISNELLDYYSSLNWPGNIRQLNSHLKKKKILSNGKRLILDKTDDELISDENIDLIQSNYLTLHEIKYNYCLKIFVENNKNFKTASDVLDISQNTLRAIINRSAA